MRLEPSAVAQRQNEGKTSIAGCLLYRPVKLFLRTLRQIGQPANGLEAHIFLDEDEESGWYIDEVIEGSTIAQVLTMTQWDQFELTRLVLVNSAMSIVPSAGSWGRPAITCI